MREIKPAKGWGLLVGGNCPYLSEQFSKDSEKRYIELQCWAKFHKCIPVILLPASEYRRLKRIEREAKKGKVR